MNNSNQDSLKRLAWEIENSQDQFKLILASCDHLDLQDKIIDNLLKVCSIPIQIIKLNVSINRLHSTLKKELAEKHASALMVLGLVSVNNIENLFISANQIREEFRRTFNFPIVLWVNNKILKKFKKAPDLKNWCTWIFFKKNPSQLLEYLRQQADKLFQEVLETGADSFLSTRRHFTESDRAELTSVIADLDNNPEKLASDLQAYLEFIQARDAYSRDQINESLKHYQKSLDFWNILEKQTEQYNSFITSITPELRKGIIYSNIGLCHYRNAELERNKAKKHWEKAKDYYQKCIKVFEKVSRQDLLGKFIVELGKVLQKLQQWEELEKIAQESKKLHQSDEMEIDLAQDYVFLAEVATNTNKPETSIQLGQKALEILNSIPKTKIDTDINKTKWLSNQSRALFLWGKNLAELNQIEEAIEKLKDAAKKQEQSAQTTKQSVQVQLENDPELYIEILTKLRSLYLKQQNYHQAFKTKHKLRSFEYEYGFRAFIGAGFLGPQKPQNLVRDFPRMIPQITDKQWEQYINHLVKISGREKYVDRLITRVKDNQHKLTVIHGQSGVGKSSLIHAAFVPALKLEVVGIRDFLPVVLQSPKNWFKELGEAIKKALQEKGIELATTPNSVTELIKVLQDNQQHNLQTVLIFDSFEDFFFIQKRQSNQKHLLSFFQFLKECLVVHFIKVILSIRQDQIYHLLSASRKTALEAINNDILSKDVLFYLENFSSEEARSVIESLTKRSQLNLDADLIDQLVTDLTELEPEGEVRPVELQVVGAALQDAKIKTLKEYQDLGNHPKSQLVEKYLDAVFEDCGSENRQLILQVLKHLIDEQGHRSLKTKSYFKSTLNIPSEMLDLILQILQGNNIIFRFPTDTEDQYQLVHDYLVQPIQKKLTSKQGREAQLTLLEKVIYSLRTPLTEIIGYSEMLSEEESHKNEIKIDGLNVPQRMANISRNMLEDMSNIKDLLKLELGTVELRPEEFRIKLLVNNEIDILKKNQQNSYFQLLDYNNLEDVGKMYADLTRVRQCFTNLLHNSLQLAKQQIVILEVDRYEENGKEWVDFQFILPKFDLAKLPMQDLFQGNTYKILSSLEETISQDKKIVQKLTITKKLCKLMGGSLNLEVNTNKGSIFTMKLPIHNENI